MNLKVKTNINNYSVIIGKNLCSKIYKIILNERLYSQKFLLVYDSKVPAQMIKSIISRFNKDKIEKKKIVLVGMMGSGKSTIGALLSKK